MRDLRHDLMCQETHRFLPRPRVFAVVEAEQQQRPEAADLVITSMEKSILSKKVTYDFARLLDGATQVSCSGFGQVMIDNM